MQQPECILLSLFKPHHHYNTHWHYALQHNATEFMNFSDLFLDFCAEFPGILVKTPLDVCLLISAIP